jgi:hypothetical protein
MAPSHKGGRGSRRRRQPPAGKPGWYKVRASDLLHSIALRHDLKAEVTGLQDCLDKILKKYKLSTGDKKKIKDCLSDLQSATEPIAFGLDSDNP